MALKESQNFSTSERLDVPDIRAIENGTVYDFGMLLRCFQSNAPYILTGYTIPVSGVLGPAQALQVVVSGAVAWIPSNQAGSFLQVDAGTPNEVLSSANANVIGSFSPNQNNYLGVQFIRVADPTTTDLREFWDVDSNSEFAKSIPTGLVLKYQFVISNTDFGTTSPIAIIRTDLSNNVTSITNAKTGMFRLGTGGLTQNPDFTYIFNPANENSLTANSPASPDPFAGGDWDLNTFKDWMNAVMSQIKNILGSARWYSNGSSAITGVNLTDLFNDAALSVMTGTGRFSQPSAGLLTWTSDLLVTSLSGRRIYDIAANPAGISIGDDQVAYLPLVRNQDFQPANVFSVTSGSYTITGAINVAGVSAGDYVKFEIDPDSAWRKVLSVAGTVITLVSSGEPTYPFSHVNEKLLRSQGSYAVGDIVVADRQNVPSASTTYWIAYRKDGTPVNATIASPGSSGAVRTSGVATITTTAPHLLVGGAIVNISGVSDPTFDGTFTVINVTSATSFTISNNGPDVPAATAGNGSVLNAARIYLRWLGEISQGETIQIDGQISADTLLYIGAMSETDSSPSYSSQKYITNGENLTVAIGALDAALYQNHAQDQQLKLIEGGDWSNTLLSTGYTILAATGAQSTSVVISNPQDEIAQVFQPSSNITVDRIAISLRANNSPTGIVQAIITADDGLGNPGSAIQVSAPINATSISTSGFALYNFDFSPSVALASGTTYHVVINSSPTFSGINTVSVGVDTSPSGIFINGYQTHNGTWAAPVSSPLTLNIQQFTGASVTVAWSSDAYIEIPGLHNTSNTISAGSVVLTANQVAYVSLNRTVDSVTVLPVSVATINSFVPTINSMIIARSVSDGVIVGTHSMKLLDGESKQIEAGVSDQILNTIAALSNADYTGQGRLVANLNATPHRVAVTAFNKLSQDATQWAKETSNLVTNFTGAQIDFSTGTVYAADGVTVLGNNFTPNTITANQYLWYSITAVVNTVDADNQFTMQIQVLPADSSGTTALNAPKATFTSGIKIGQVLVQDNGSGGSGTILNILQSNIIQLTSGSGDGGSGATPVTFFDPVSTVLPTGATVTIDGIAGANGDLVLYGNLISGNNEVYKLGGVGTSITWTPQRLFNGQITPLNTNQVIVEKGNSFADQVGTFNGTKWLFNFTVRYFNGADYWEQSALFTVTLSNNTTGNVFSVAAAGSEHWILGYSISRGTNTETGNLYINSDDTNAVVTKSTSYIGDVETSFSAAIVTGNLQLNYTTDNSGPSATMKFFYQRWSNNAGGPNGVPNYTPGGGGSGVTSLNTLSGALTLAAGSNITITPSGGNTLTIASTGGSGSPAGSNGDIQFNNAGSFGAATGQLEWDSTQAAIVMNGLNINTLSGNMIITDNQPTPQVLFTYSASVFTNMVMDYSLVRGTNYFVGTAWVVTDGSSIAVLTQQGTSIGSTGIIIDANYNAGNVQVSYTSTSTGSSGSMKVAIRRWQS